MVFSNFVQNMSMNIITDTMYKKDIYGKIHELQESDNEIIAFKGKTINIQFPLTDGITETIEYTNNKPFFFVSDITEIIKNYYDSYIEHMEYKAILDFIKKNNHIPYEKPNEIKKKFLFLNEEKKNFNGFTYISDNTYKLDLGIY